MNCVYARTNSLKCTKLHNAQQCKLLNHSHRKLKARCHISLEHVMAVSLVLDIFFTWEHSVGQPVQSLAHYYTSKGC